MPCHVLASFEAKYNNETKVSQELLKIKQRMEAGNPSLLPFPLRLPINLYLSASLRDGFSCRGFSSRGSRV